jgi:guanylate kinase
LKEHPELRQILNDFLSSCLLEQPENVYEYAKKFFSYFNYQKDTLKLKPIVMSGCSGVGKVIK